MVRNVIARRATWALEAALSVAEKQDRACKGHMIRNHLEGFMLHFEGYAEPGCDSASGIVATGNYNNVDHYNAATGRREVLSTLPSRLLKIWEKLGIECEWSDEWTECGGCSKLVRTEPDSHDWTPSYTYQDGDIWCSECLSERACWGGDHNDGTDEGQDDAPTEP